MISRAAPATDRSEHWKRYIAFQIHTENTPTQKQHIRRQCSNFRCRFFSLNATIE
jgi:hypothetical protein